MLAPLPKGQKLLIAAGLTAALFGLGYLGGRRLASPPSLKAEAFSPPPAATPTERVGPDPSEAPRPRSSGKKTPPPLHSIGLNSSSAEELCKIPGIGPATAAKIIELRTQKGRFSDIEAVGEVKGLTGKRLEKLLPYLKLD